MERSGSGAGGCCIARYTHAPNYYNYSYDLSQMDRIMLRYRPIAPKPVSGTGTGPTRLNEDVKPAGGKAKRRNSCGNNSSGSNKRRKSSRSPDEIKSEGEQKCHVERERVTLPLLPESPDLVSPSPRSNHSRPIIHNQKLSSSSMPMWLSFGGDNHEVVVGTTSVMVEGVTDTWLDGTGLGRTDEERRRRLDEDTCPGFISDGWNRVWWTNEAFRRMATGGTAAVAVRLGMREKVELPKVKLFPAFTCRVRVQYGKDGSHTMTVPCDVWRMDGGGFAWRLDVKAALSLGR